MTGEGSVDAVMRAQRRQAELFDVVRVLLLFQGAILVVNTLEAAIFAIAFSAAVTATMLMTAGSALAVLVSRARLSTESGRGRRALAIVEGVIIASFAIDTALAYFLMHQPLPLVAVLTRFLLPVATLALLARTRDVMRRRGELALGEAA